MNEVLNLLNQRMSLRKYEEIPVAEEDKSYVLTSTLRAPTAGNLMLYSILQVSDKVKKERLSVLCDQQSFIAKAPLVYIFLADLERLYDYFIYSNVEMFLKEKGQNMKKPGKGALMMGISDALIAAQNMVIAGESVGLGSCYIGDILENYEEVKELFSLPKYTFPIAMITMGYYPEGMNRRITPRYDQKFILHHDSYQKLTVEELEEMFSEKEKWFLGSSIQDVENFGQLIYTRKFGTEFSREMDRTVELLLKNWE